MLEKIRLGRVGEWLDQLTQLGRPILVHRGAFGSNQSSTVVLAF